MDNETLVFPEPGHVHIESRPVPELGSDKVLVETVASLVSTGTELTLLSGEFPNKSAWSVHGEYPVIPGYSSVGVVCEIGDEVSETAVGDRVAAKTPHQRFTAVSTDETFLIPDEVADDEATFFKLAGIAMNGVRTGGVTWGETVATHGLGLVGQLATQFCTVAGARPVIAFDVSPTRLNHCSDIASVTTVDPSAEDPVEIVEALARGRLADVVFECTGSPDVIPDEFDVLREQG